jgi:hypothetical protein
MNDSKQPISAFDEICHLTEQVMRGMELEVLLELRKQANREFHKSLLAIRALTTIINEKLEAQGKQDASRS